VDQAKRYDPAIIIGEPMGVEFPADGSTLVQARLYPLQPNAVHVWNILRSGGKLKASVGGSCEKKVGHDGVVEIARIWWSHLALTPYPVNDHTLVSLQPFSAFVKALGVGAAAPLVMQDLQGARLGHTPDLRQRWRALTELLQQQIPTLTTEEAQAMALLLMRQRKEERPAFVAAFHTPLAI
jgi:hypothetical protein